MVAPRVLVLRAPGTNCDVETEYAFNQVGAVASRIHVNRLIENPSLIDDFQILCFPGGFSYGDDIAAGRILAVQIQAHLSEALEKFRSTNRLVLGICNGFQIMMRLGVFFAKGEESSATLALNRQARFEDRWVHLHNTSPKCVFLRGIETMYLPMAHAEGRFVTKSPETFQRLTGAGQLALRYSRPDGSGWEGQLGFPENPNGAEGNVAGICDESGRIFGLMPHPERHFEATHHPYWTRLKDRPEFGEGRQLFVNAVSYFQ